MLCKDGARSPFSRARAWALMLAGIPPVCIFPCFGSSVQSNLWCCLTVESLGMMCTAKSTQVGVSGGEA